MPVESSLSHGGLKGIVGIFGKIKLTEWYMLITSEWQIYNYLEYYFLCIFVLIYFGKTNIYNIAILKI